MFLSLDGTVILAKSFLYSGAISKALDSTSKDCARMSGLDFWEEGTGPADIIHRGYLIA